MDEDYGPRTGHAASASLNDGYPQNGRQSPSRSNISAPAAIPGTVPPFGMDGACVRAHSLPC
jgi:hypothetical protein